MRVIALISLALALVASSMPLSTRSKDASLVEYQTGGSYTGGGVIVSTEDSNTFGVAGSQASDDLYSGSGGGVTVEEDTGSFGVGGKQTTDNTYPGDVAVAVDTGDVGGDGSVTPARRNGDDTPLRSRTTAGDASGEGMVLGLVTGKVNGADKAAQGASNARGAAKGGLPGAAGSLTGSGSDA